jgi:mono/diheme cytochrome c family protein
MELVAAEPLVEDPVVIRFDEAGRLWVVEMRGFMVDLDRTGEDEPTGRVKILTDGDGDGRMDEARVFLNGLVMPRALAFVPGGVLVAENKPLWFVPILADGTAGDKVLIDPDYGGTGMPEHSGNGLLRGMDNWLYSAKSDRRHRFRPDGWSMEETEFRGQWGISRDDAGRLYYNYNWSQLHGDLVPPNTLTRNPNHSPTHGLSVGVSSDQRVFPVRETPAINRGYLPNALGEDGRSIEFTSACSPMIHRGDALPEGYRGNAFVCEPAANLVKRSTLREGEFSISANQAQEGREFLASSDERFRPVALCDGPDGALYVADMYRGVIQHGAYMTPYLREQSEQRGLEAPVHLGRIWRIVGRDAPQHEMAFSGAECLELVQSLGHPNGWVRDTAQRLLVDGKRSDLAGPIRSWLAGDNWLGAFHALWTLEGLNELTRDDAWEALEFDQVDVQMAALQTLPKFVESNSPDQRQLLAWMRAKVDSYPTRLQTQMALTLGELDGSETLVLMEELWKARAEVGLMRDAIVSGLEGREIDFLDRLWASVPVDAPPAGYESMIEALAAAIGRSGGINHIRRLLALAESSSEALEWRERALLAGLLTLTGGREIEIIPLKKEPSLLARLQRETARGDLDRAESFATLFYWPGHDPKSRGTPSSGASMISPKVRAQVAAGRQIYVSVCSGCHGREGEGMQNLAPPLLDSEWVLGDPAGLVRILLHGLEGPVDVAGTRYEPPNILPEMPSLAAMDNTSLAAVLTYIRSAWDHEADPVESRIVSKLRIEYQGRLRPWTESELEAEQSARSR